MSVGERIVALRKARGMSQGQLADALSLTRQAISKWENDLSSPDTLNLIRLAEVLDTEVLYLATGQKPVYTYPVYVDKVRLVEKEVPVERRVEVRVPYPVKEIVEVERIVEKPVLKKSVRYRIVRNPLEFLAVGLVCFLLGLLLGRIL